MDRTNGRKSILDLEEETLPDIKKLGKGSFGVIFSPPLENDNYTPTSNDVVKIYNSKPIYNKAIANVEITKTYQILQLKQLHIKDSINSEIYQKIYNLNYDLVKL